MRLMNINLQIFPICHAGVGRHPGNDCQPRSNLDAGKRRDDGVLHRFVTAQRGNMLVNDKLKFNAIATISPFLCQDD